jgi:hypothetical protein
MTTLIMTGFHRDLGKKRSHVSITWDDDDAEKRLPPYSVRLRPCRFESRDGKGGPDAGDGIGIAHSGARVLTSTPLIINAT